MLRPGATAGRPTLTLALALILAAGSALWLGPASPARADATGNPCADASVCVGVSTPPHGGGSSGGSGGGGGGGVQVCTYQGAYVPCVTDYGYYDSNDNCYYALMQPQPQPGDPYWEGHNAGDGSVYNRTCPFGGAGGTAPAWLQNPPPTPPTITPAQLAQQAGNSIQLQRAKVRTAPSAADQRTALVGAPIWLWIDNSTYTWSPKAKAIPVSAAVPGLRVDGLIWSTGVDWDMGDGGTAKCSAPGTAYTNADGAARSPDCSYTYLHPSNTQPGQKYAITAAVHWTGTWWASDGVSHGTFEIDPVAAPATVLTVGELQVLN